MKYYCNDCQEWFENCDMKEELYLFGETIEIDICPCCGSEDIEIKDYEMIHAQQLLDDAKDRRFNESRGK